MGRWIYVVAGFAVSFLFFLFVLNHVGVNSIGVAYNSAGGEVWIQHHPGWYLTSPTVFVTTISTLPRRLQIPTEARVLNWKLVRFDPGALP